MKNVANQVKKALNESVERVPTVTLPSEFIDMIKDDIISCIKNDWSHIISECDSYYAEIYCKQDWRSGDKYPIKVDIDVYDGNTETFSEEATYAAWYEIEDFLYDFIDNLTYEYGYQPLQ